MYVSIKKQTINLSTDGVLINQSQLKVKNHHHEDDDDDLYARTPLIL